MAPTEIIDISPEISEATAVFPGDMRFSRRVALDFDHGSNLLLSSIQTTVHIGAHADARSHYHRGAEAITEMPLDAYYGDCQVISVKIAPGARIRSFELGSCEIRAPRILFKTGSFPDPNQWNGDFNSLSGELVDFLAVRGVKLIGIDTPSIDPAEDKELQSHRAIHRHRIANLEGLVLDHVEDGTYLLSAFPLKIKSADAGPVRAVLIRSK